MSYCRFLDADVYIFLSVSGYLECCWCCIEESFSYRATDTDEMIEHLTKHREAGQYVPDYAIEGLLEDQEENDKWIANFHRA